MNYIYSGSLAGNNDAGLYTAVENEDKTRLRFSSTDKPVHGISIKHEEFSLDKESCVALINDLDNQEAISIEIAYIREAELHLPREYVFGFMGKNDNKTLYIVQSASRVQGWYVDVGGNTLENYRTIPLGWAGEEQLLSRSHVKPSVRTRPRVYSIGRTEVYPLAITDVGALGVEAIERSVSLDEHMVQSEDIAHLYLESVQEEATISIEGVLSESVLSLKQTLPANTAILAMFPNQDWAIIHPNGDVEELDTSSLSVLGGLKRAHPTEGNNLLSDKGVLVRKSADTLDIASYDLINDRALLIPACVLYNDPSLEGSIVIDELSSLLPQISFNGTISFLSGTVVGEEDALLTAAPDPQPGEILLVATGVSPNIKAYQSALSIDKGEYEYQSLGEVFGALLPKPTTTPLVVIPRKAVPLPTDIAVETNPMKRPTMVHRTHGGVIFVDSYDSGTGSFMLMDQSSTKVDLVGYPEDDKTVYSVRGTLHVSEEATFVIGMTGSSVGTAMSNVFRISKVEGDYSLECSHSVFGSETERAEEIPLQRNEDGVCHIDVEVGITYAEDEGVTAFILVEGTEVLKTVSPIHLDRDQGMVAKFGSYAQTNVLVTNLRTRVEDHAFVRGTGIPLLPESPTNEGASYIIGSKGHSDGVMQLSVPGELFGSQWIDRMIIGTIPLNSPVARIISTDKAIVTTGASVLEEGEFTLYGYTQESDLYLQLDTLENGRIHSDTVPVRVDKSVPRTMGMVGVKTKAVLSDIAVAPPMKVALAQVPTRFQVTGIGAGCVLVMRNSVEPDGGWRLFLSLSLFSDSYIPGGVCLLLDSQIREDIKSAILVPRGNDGMPPHGDSLVIKEEGYGHFALYQSTNEQWEKVRSTVIETDSTFTSKGIGEAVPVDMEQGMLVIYDNNWSTPRSTIIRAVDGGVGVSILGMEYVFRGEGVVLLLHATKVVLLKDSPSREEDFPQDVDAVIYPANTGYDVRLLLEDKAVYGSTES